MVHVSIEEEKIYVTTPYSEAFVTVARNLQGKYDRKTKKWAFSTDEWDILRVKLLEVFGEDGVTETERVTVEFDAAPLINEESDHLDLFGFSLVKRFHRNAPVKLGEGVIVLEGGFPSTGGGKRPVLNMEERTVLRVKNIPRVMYEKERKKGVVDMRIVRPQGKSQLLEEMEEEKNNCESD